MALDLNEIIARSQQLANDVFPTKAEEKEANLFASTQDKQMAIHGTPMPTKIQSIPDGDGFVPMGGSENRAQGYDSYEINHPELNQDPAFQRHKVREKQRYSQEFGVPVDQVTDQMTQEKAEQDKLKFLHQLVKKPGDAPWSPGPINNPNQPLVLGSKEHPLNIPANTQVTGQDKYKRDIANIYNPNTGQLVNESMQSGFNALNFDGKYPNQMKMMNKNQQVQKRQVEMDQPNEVGEVVKGNISKMDRDVKVNDDGSFDSIKPITVKDDKGYDTIIPSIVNGKELSRKEAIAHHKKTGEHLGKYTSEAATNNALEKIAKTGRIDTLRRKDPATLTSQEKGELISSRLKELETQKENSYWGQAADVTQSSLAQTGAGMVDAVADAASQVFGDGSNTNISIPGFDKSVEEYKDKEAMDKEFGANKYQSEKMHADIQELKDKADKDPSFMNIAEYIAKGAVSTPQIFAESAGEIASYIHPVGWGLQILNRTNNDAETFAQNNDGTKMTGEQATLSFATNTAAYMLDKVMGKIAIKTGIKGIKAPFKSKLKREITEGTLMAMGGAAGEGIQEYIDQVQQIFNTEGLTQEDALERLKRIGSSKEAIDAAALGAVAGGTTAIASKATPIATQTADKALKANTERRIRNREIAAGEYSTDADAEFIQAEFDAKRAEPESIKTDSEKALKELDNMNDESSFATSKIKTLREFGESLKDQANKDVTLGSKEHKNVITEEINNLISNNPASAGKIDAKYGTNFDGKTQEQIAEIVENLDIDKIEDMVNRSPKNFGLEQAKKVNSSQIMEKNFDTFKDNVRKTLEGRVQLADTQLAAHRTTAERFQEGVDKRGGSQKNSAINVDKIKEESTQGFMKDFVDSAANLISLGGYKNDSTSKRLNKYSNKSLELASTELEGKIKKAKDKKEAREFKDLQNEIKNLQDKRTKSKKQSGIDIDGDKQIRNLRINKGNRKETLKHLTDALIQKEMNDQRDVDATRDLIKSAHEQKFLTDEQLKKYNNRLNKISKNAEPPSKDVLAAEKKLYDDHQKETGKSDTEIENMQTNEFTNEDLKEDQKEILKDAEENAKRDEDFDEETKDIDEKNFTDEQKETQETNKENNKKTNTRLLENASRRYQFTESEADLNNDYGKMDEYFEGAETIDLKDAFSDEELDILNICK